MFVLNHKTPEDVDAQVQDLVGEGVVRIVMVN